MIIIFSSILFGMMVFIKVKRVNMSVGDKRLLMGCKIYLKLRK